MISSTQTHNISYKYIPRAISRRIENISTEDSSFTGRIHFYKDALKIIKDHPILGTGGGGWKAIYQAYQSSGYFTTEVHNFFLQLWVETGTVGFLALAVLCFTTLITAYKTLISDSAATTKALTWGALSGAIALAGHSAMDFNLSLGGVALYLWQLFGVVKFSGALSSQEVKTKELKTSAAWPLAGVSCVLIVLSFPVSRLYLWQQAVKSIEQQDIMKAKIL